MVDKACNCSMSLCVTPNQAARCAALVGQAHGSARINGNQSCVQGIQLLGHCTHNAEIQLHVLGVCVNCTGYSTYLLVQLAQNAANYRIAEAPLRRSF